MVLRKLTLLVLLMIVVGCVPFQIGTHCSEAKDIQVNTVVSILPYDYKIFVIDLTTQLPEDYPTYMIYIKTDGHPINLKILDRLNYIYFVDGRTYRYWNMGKYIVDGTYTFHPSTSDFMYYIVLENPMNCTIDVYIQIERI